MARRPEAAEFATDGAALARLIAHELNNIAVPLQGFIELAAATDGQSGSAAQLLNELRVSATRLSDLSRDLAMFESHVPAAFAVKLLDCLPANVAAAADSVAALTVLASPRAIHRSLALLAQLVPAPHAWTVDAQTSRSRLCETCGARLPQRLVLIGLRSPRMPLPGALRDPLCPDHKLRIAQRLQLAAAAHAAHRGCAHWVSLAANAGSAGGIALALKRTRSVGDLT